MLRRPLTGPRQAALSAALDRLGARFAEAGFAPVDVPHLFAGNTLLDLYGEDLRARAFLFPDAERDNELCLRPDFTVPVAQAHGAGGWSRAAAYTYSGPVFRRQPQGQGRLTEYLQAGIESFGTADRTPEDARVLALLHRGLESLGISDLATRIGDLSVPFALLEALDMPGRRRAALRRHFWRPHRFKALIERACAPSSPASPREVAGEALGLRRIEDVRARLDRLAEEAREPAMPRRDADLIGALMEVECPAADAPARLRALAAGVGIGPAIDRLEARLDALSAAGLDPSTMVFDANFGRNLEYYDGFVFEICAAGQRNRPALAGGGRYDALTARLGAPQEIPAIGGIIRPETALEAAG